MWFHLVLHRTSRLVHKLRRSISAVSWILQPQYFRQYLPQDKTGILCSYSLLWMERIKIKLSTLTQYVKPFLVLVTSRSTIPIERTFLLGKSSPQPDYIPFRETVSYFHQQFRKPNTFSHETTTTADRYGASSPKTSDTYDLIRANRENVISTSCTKLLLQITHHCISIADPVCLL